MLHFNDSIISTDALRAKGRPFLAKSGRSAQHSSCESENREASFAGCVCEFFMRICYHLQLLVASRHWCYRPDLNMPTYVKRHWNELRGDEHGGSGPLGGTSKLMMKVGYLVRLSIAIRAFAYVMVNSIWRMSSVD